MQGLSRKCYLCLGTCLRNITCLLYANTECVHLGVGQFKHFTKYNMWLGLQRFATVHGKGTDACSCTGRSLWPVYFWPTWFLNRETTECHKITQSPYSFKAVFIIQPCASNGSAGWNSFLSRKTALGRCIETSRMRNPITLRFYLPSSTCILKTLMYQN